ncbi:MAG: DedA family protein [Actinomycetales bacterium]
MIDFATQLVETIGIFGAGLFIAIESIVIPLPSEFVLLLSGFNVSIGEFQFIPLLIATTTGSLIGALVLYTIGYGISKERVNYLTNRFGKFVGIKESDVDKAFKWFDRYGAWTIFFGRLFPLVRSLVSIPAGLSEMNVIKFALLTFGGSSIFNATWITIGMQLEDRWKDAEGWAKNLENLVNVGIIALAIFLIARAIIKKVKA